MADLATKLKTVFSDFDENQDHTISRDRLQSVLYELDPSFTQEELDTLFEEADKNGNGVIEYDEFIDFICFLGGPQAFLGLHSPNGQTWINYVGPVPPVVTSDGNLSGAWAECMYAAVVYELANPNFQDMEEYADMGPVAMVVQLCDERGYGYASEALHEFDNYAREALQAPAEEGSLVFLQHKARNGQTWEQYLKTSPVQVDCDGLGCGAWGECITAAVIFEHQNPGWDQLGPYSADGPAGQVLRFLDVCGHGDQEGALSQTEEKTHAALSNGEKVPVFDGSLYQASVGIIDAPVVNEDPVEPSGRKRALLVGCNYPGSEAQLNGCINDVHRWRDMLCSDLYGFRERDVLMLVDDGANDPNKQSTRANILNSIRWLVDDAQPGDVLFFQFSGHGGQRQCQAGDTGEDDGMDELLIPTDYMSKGIIVDHELFDLLVVPLPSSCKLTVILDCCHSGTALDLPFTWNGEGSDWDCAAHPWHTAGDVQMFSGCEDAQCSMDCTINGVAGGAMTTAMCDTLEALGGQPTAYEDLLQRLLEVLHQRGMKQRPKLSSSQPFCRDDKSFSLAEGIIPNMNEVLGQDGSPPSKPPRQNASGFQW